MASRFSIRILMKILVRQRPQNGLDIADGQKILKIVNKDHTEEYGLWNTSSCPAAAADDPSCSRLIMVLVMILSSS